MKTEQHRWIRKLDSLKVKLTALFLVLAIIPLALVTFILLSQFTSILENQTDGERERVAAAQAKMVDDWLKEQVGSIEKLIKEHPEFSNAKASTIVPVLKVLAQSNPYVDVISYVNKDGYITNNQDVEMDGSSYDNIKTVKESKKLFISDITENDVSKKYTIFLDVPILSEKGEFAGDRCKQIARPYKRN